MLWIVEMIAISETSICVDLTKPLGPTNRLVLGTNLIDNQKGRYGDSA